MQKNADLDAFGKHACIVISFGQHPRTDRYSRLLTTVIEDRRVIVYKEGLWRRRGNGRDQYPAPGGSAILDRPGIELLRVLRAAQHLT